MTIEEFLEENTYNLTPEEYNQAVTDLDSLDANAWVKKYSPLMMEKTSGWNEVAEVKQSKPLADRITSAFKDVEFNPGKSYKNDVYEKDFSDVPREKFDEALSKMKQYYDAEVKARDAEYLKEKRKQEVKDWGFIKNIATSDYEKQRYIDDPESALFGEQAPGLGDAPNTRWGSIADLGLGVAGAVGDALPGLGSMAGAGIRTARDVGHVLTDSPYQKSAKNIVFDALADAGLSAGTAWLPNFMRERRMMGKGGMMPDAINKVVGLERDAKQVARDAAAMSTVISEKMPLSEDKRFLMMHEIYDKMADSPLKSELAPFMSQSPDKIDWSLMRSVVENNLGTAAMANSEVGRNYIRNSFANARMTERAPSLEAAEQFLDATGNEMTKRQVKKALANGEEVLPVRAKTRIDPLSQRILASRELTNKEKILKPVFVKANDFIGGDVGGAALQLSKTASGKRSPSKPERVRTPEEQALIDSIKKREARFWDKKVGFKPNKVEGDPLWEAYSEFKEEERLKDLVKKSLLGGK